MDMASDLLGRDEEEEEEEDVLMEESDFEWEEDDGLDNFEFGECEKEGNGSDEQREVRRGEGEGGEKLKLNEEEEGEEEDNDEGEEGKQHQRQRRPGWDAQTRTLARETHNVHTQLLLTRVRVLECALADDALLRARLMSLAPEPPTTSSSTVSQSGAWVERWHRACDAHGAHAVIEKIVQHMRTMLHIVWGFGRGGSESTHQPLLPPMPSSSSSLSSPSGPVQSVRDKLLRDLHGVLDDIGEDAVGTCSVEFLAALSCAMFRLIGFETRLVCSLNPLGLKPGCLDEDDPRDDIVLHSRKHDTMKATKHMPRSRFGTMAKTSVDARAAEEKKKTSKAKTKTTVMSKDDEAAPSATGASGGGIAAAAVNGGGGSHDDDDDDDLQPVRGKSKADIEFEAQMAVALAATAVTTRKRGRRKADAREADGEDAITKKKRTHDKDKQKRKLDKEGTSLPVTHWLEIFVAAGPAHAKDELNTHRASVSGKNKRWITIDPYRMLIDCATDMEAATALGRPVSYCVAVNVGGDVVDVTRRYASKFSRSVERRANDAWWNATLTLMRRANASIMGCASQPIDVDATAAAGAREAEEEEELAARVKTEKMPSNQAEYKKHHLYALERWLTKYQIIHPRRPILGYIAGHPVFPRANVRDLHTADRWLREGRIVREEELDQPVKCVASREQRRVQREREKLREARRKHERKHVEPGIGMGNLGGSHDENGGANGDDDDNDHDDANRPAPGAETNPATWLYGDWQTDAYVPPKAENGIVPRNARGHIDVWSPDFVPEGATHIRLPYIASIARKLGIDYAPAMVGFDMKMGKSVPRFDGIVVCSEYAEVLELAFEEENQRRTDAAAKKATDEAVAAWSVLLRVIWRRHMLEKEDIAEDAEKKRRITARGDERQGRGATGSTVNDLRPPRPVDAREDGIDEDDGEGRTDDALPVVREHFF